MTDREIEIGRNIIAKVKDGEVNRLEEENRLLLLQIDEFKQNRTISLNALSQPWKIKSNNILNEPMYLDDPIFDCIFLEPKLKLLLHHPIVQRLKYIKQLSFAYTFPSATHTRLSHSLGVQYLMEEALTKIINKDLVYLKKVEKITEKEEIIHASEGKLALSQEQIDDLKITGKTAALLHDIGHGPFSHTIDRYIGYIKGIQDSADKEFCFEYLNEYLKDFLTTNKFNLDALKKIFDRKLNKKGTYYQLIKEILDSKCDVDRMDYLTRDSHFSGIPIGKINARKLIENMVVLKNDEAELTLAYRETAIPYIKHLLTARINMYTNCYEDSAKVAAERMIVKATHDFLKNSEPVKINLDDIKILTDEQLYTLILSNSKPSENCYKLVMALMTGAIFEPIFSVDLHAFKPAQRPYGIDRYVNGLTIGNEELITVYIDWIQSDEDKLAKEGNLKSDDYWKVAIHFPAWENTEEASIDIPILRREGVGFKICTIDKYPDVYQLYKQIQHERMKLKVFVHSSLTPEEKELIKNRAKQEFGTQKSVDH